MLPGSFPHWVFNPSGINGVNKVGLSTPFGVVRPSITLGGNLFFFLEPLALGPFFPEHISFGVKNFFPPRSPYHIQGAIGDKFGQIRGCTSNGASLGRFTGVYHRRCWRPLSSILWALPKTPPWGSLFDKGERGPPI